MKHYSLITLFLCLSMLYSCFEGQSLRKMKLENDILAQCDYIHEVLKTEFGIDRDGAQYADVCGEVSGIITDQILENRLPEQIKKMHADNKLLQATIRNYMLKNSKKIEQRLK